jgi:hypothetical protein
MARCRARGVWLAGGRATRIDQSGNKGRGGERGRIRASCMSEKVEVSQLLQLNTIHRAKGLAYISER